MSPFVSISGFAVAAFAAGFPGGLAIHRLTPTATCCRGIRRYGSRWACYPSADADGYMLPRHSPLSFQVGWRCVG